MRLKAVRLYPGEDLKTALAAFVWAEEITAGTVISAVGSLSHVEVRMAGPKTDSQDVRSYEDAFEIVSLIGNVGQDRMHLHISIADAEGRVIGGHLKGKAIVATTVELVLATDGKLEFSEETDPRTGFDELKIRDKHDR